MKIEITDEMVDTVSNNVYGAYWSRGMREDAGAIIKAVAPMIADQVLERAAVHIDHKIGSVAAAAIRALKEPTNV